MQCLVERILLVRKTSLKYEYNGVFDIKLVNMLHYSSLDRQIYYLNCKSSSRNNGFVFGFAKKKVQPLQELQLIFAEKKEFAKNFHVYLSAQQIYAISRL